MDTGMRRPTFLLAVLGALIAAIAGVSATWVVREARASMTEQVQAGEMLAAAERAGALGHVLDDARERLRVNVNAPLAAAAVASGNGTVLQPGLDNALGLPGVAGVAISDPTGRLLAFAGDRPAHLGRVGMQVESNEDHSRAVVTIGVDIRTPDGTLVGWADEALDLDRISPQLKQPFVEFRGATSLATTDGTIVMTTLPTTTTSIRDPELRRLVGASKSGFVRYYSTRFGGERLAAVHGVGGTDLVVIVGADAEAAFAPADRITRKLGTAFTLTVGATGLLTAAGFLILRSGRRRLEHDGRVAAELARTDALTGVGNRRAFDAAGAALEASDRHASVILLDVDHLKTINDVRGHAAGDAAIVAIAAAIRRVVRAGDCVARIGGDEFAVVLDGAPEARARELAATIRSAVGDLDDLSVSVGVASGHGREIATMILEADAALYAAKRARPSGLVLV
jgi:diguanylate cyclase (GGDEF)-like protein